MCKGERWPHPSRQSPDEKTHKSSNRAKCVGQTTAFVNGRPEDVKAGNSRSRWEKEMKRRRRLTRQPISHIGPGHGNQINAPSAIKFVGCSSRDSGAIFLVIERLTSDPGRRFRNNQTLTPSKTIKWPPAGVCSYHDDLTSATLSGGGPCTRGADIEMRLGSQVPTNGSE